MGSRWQVFEPIVDLLAVDHEVVSVDLPGFGGTAPRPGLPADPAGYAAWLADLIEGLRIERPHVAGNSLGGAIALELGRTGHASAVTAFSPIGFWQKPGEIWCRTLVGTAHITLRAGWPAVRVAVAAPIARRIVMAAMVGRPELLRRDETRGGLDALAHGPGVAPTLDGFRDYRWDQDSELGNLRGLPVTVAWGTRDVLLPDRTQAARARALLTAAHHVELPRCGHVPFTDDPSLCADVIRTTRPAAT